MPIEQAVFTSARTARGDGYQLVARSPGVKDEDERELAVWGPSHGALCMERDEGTSINFHRLSSGSSCVSKTVAAGQEYSGRGGARVYTHFLLVPPDVMARFANNPFAVLRATWAKGLLAVHDRWPENLESFSLVGRSAIVDEGLLSQLAEQWGPLRVAQLVAAAMTPGAKLLAGAGNAETLIGGLLQCFPKECRAEISFTTGLRYSPRRAFRLAFLDDDVAEQRRAVRQDGVSIVDLSGGAATDLHSHHWAAFVAKSIADDRLSNLISQIQRSEITMENLDDLGDRLMREGSKSLLGAGIGSNEADPRNISQTAHAMKSIASNDQPVRSSQSATSSQGESYDVPRYSSLQGPRLTVATGSPSNLHNVADPVAIELLEKLDDAVY
ncbi:MAG TPA: hypothetical protein VGJ04_01920, partial [Pirellulales bacterium]